MTKDDGRERGILTSADREFLRSDPDEYSRQARHAREDAIVDRVRNAILDFTVLFEGLKPDDFNRVFGRYPNPKSGRYDDPALEAGLRDALAFILQSGGGAGLLRGMGNTPSHTTGIEAERLFKEAVERLAWRKRYQVKKTILEVEAEPIHWHELEQSLEAGDELSPEQLAHFLSRDDVDTSEIQDQVHSMVFDKSE